MPKLDKWKLPGMLSQPGRVLQGYLKVECISPVLFNVHIDDTGDSIPSYLPRGNMQICR